MMTKDLKKGIKTDMLYYFLRALRMIRLMIARIFHKGLKLSCRRCDISLLTELRFLKDGKIHINDSIATLGRTTIASSGLIEIESLFLNRYCVIACYNHIKIGKSCAFGPMVSVYDHDHLFGENGVEDGYSTGEVIIGDNVWIGANCVILKNTHIGNNCVIGAGCIVQGDVPDNSLVTMDRTLNVVRLEERVSHNQERTIT